MGKKRIAIMQPYFFPYIGYFQLIDAVDEFVLYDNLQYTKKGWINRNRFLHGGQDATFTVPIRKASDFLNIDEREVSKDFARGKVLNRIRSAYRRAPFFVPTFELFRDALECDEANLFRFVKQSIRSVCDHLGISARIIDSSTVPIDHSARGQDKVLAICEWSGADCYVNAIGGLDLYEPSEFESRGIELRFIRSEPLSYSQFDHGFVPWLSILDVMMFNSAERIRSELLKGYTLVEGMARVQ